MIWQNEHPASEAASGRRECLLGILLVALTLLAYQPVWHAGFVWDDDELLTANPTVKSLHLSDPGALAKVWFSTASIDYYPMTYTLWWAELRLWGNNLAGFHLVNVLLHALSAVLLWSILLRLKIPGAALAAALFGLHPVNVESVAWISEGKNTLSLFFSLCALLSYLKFEDGRGQKWYGVALLLFAFALFSKTAAAPLAVVLPGLAWWRRGRIEWRDTRRALPFFVIALAECGVTIWFHYNRAMGQEAIRADGFWARLAGAGWALWFYLYKAVLPLNLAFVYPRWRIEPGKGLSYLPILLFTVALLGSFARWKKREAENSSATPARALFFTLAYFTVMLLPVLGFLNIYFMRYSLVADHWQYFAIIGPIALAAGAIRKPYLAVPVLLTLGFLTWKQAGYYGNEERLWLRTIHLNPDCWMAHNNLGLVFLQQSRTAEAAAQFRQAIKIKPDYSDAYNNLGMVLDVEGKRNEAVGEFLAALKYRPSFDEPYYNIGRVYLGQGRLDEAVAQFQTAVKLNPDYDKAWANLGITFACQGHLDKAMDQYRRAIAIAPGNAYAHNALGRALETQNKIAEAAAQYSEAVRAKPDFAEARQNLGAILTTQGKFALAQEQLEEAAKIEPSSASIHYDLGNALVRQYQFRAAADQYAKALRLKSDYLEAHFNLALALSQLGDPDGAMEHYRAVLRLNPRFAPAAEKLATLMAHQSKSGTLPAKDIPRGTQKAAE